MFLPLSALTVAASLVIPVADQIPNLNVNPTCSGGATSAAGGGRSRDVCIRTELSARDQLAAEWDEFPPAERRRCVQLATMTNLPSYVQVLTCLEMAREAGKLPEARERGTVGLGR